MLLAVAIPNPSVVIQQFLASLHRPMDQFLATNAQNFLLSSDVRANEIFSE